jgi:hypothetical protein
MENKKEGNVNTGVSNQYIIKIAVGVVFIIFGAYLLFNAMNKSNKSYVDYSYKYETKNATFVKATKSGNRYEAHYEYEYDDVTYNAIYQKTFDNEGEIPNTQIIQVNRDNPEDYVFGATENKESNYNIFLIPGIVMLFGLLSIVLTVFRII